MALVGCVEAVFLPRGRSRSAATGFHTTDNGSVLSNEWTGPGVTDGDEAPLREWGDRYLDALGPKLLDESGIGAVVGNQDIDGGEGREEAERRAAQLAGVDQGHDAGCVGRHHLLEGRFAGVRFGQPAL